MDAISDMVPEHARELLRWDREHLWHPWSPVDARWPLMVSGEGCFVTDASGHRYLDARACTLNAALGYGHAAIIDAVTAQMTQLMTYDLSYGATSPAITLARRLAAMMPGPLTRTFFTGSGAEATEAAIRIARVYHQLTGEPERRVVLTLHDGYHGATLAALAATGSEFRRAGAGPLPEGFATIRTPRCYMCAGGVPHEQCDVPGPDDVTDMIARIGADRVAAVMIEPVLGVGGIIPLPDGYLAGARRTCDEHGVLLIVDEVMTGLGRTGRMFGFQHDDGVVPDIVTTGKHLTGGHFPLAAVTTTQAVYEAFAGDPLLGGLRHGHTTSGHATGCAAALACLDVIDRDGLVGRARQRGTVLLSELERLRRHPAVRDVRGRGLLAGVELASDALAGQVAEQCMRRGVLVRPMGAVLQIAPPLIITEEQVRRIAAVIGQACAHVVAGVR
ncbi:aspartate aminotransferase family protein [Frankia sp. R43]|uniref:aminotransferase family protein n=1 Tax=Frankia sp. R43 TaxID=269536 RepID=UPI000A616EAF|nr:aminotransferase class III-fold pyridoxal phosphate-dependent enzyme [Frankia sp. R43]